MSLAAILTRGHQGLQAPLVTVEVHICNGLPQFSLVGLPEAAVRESRDRVRSALLHAGFEFPAQRITVNLAPAELPKHGGGLDLPIALGILIASGQISGQLLAGVECMGELSLGGAICAVSGLLPMVMAAVRDDHAVIVPGANLDEAAMVPGARIISATHLLEVTAHLARKSLLSTHSVSLGMRAVIPAGLPDFQDVHGHYQIKRALEIAAAGQHNVLMEGPPGTGKSMLARRIQSILPPLDEAEALEVAAIASLAGQLPCADVWRRPPFRAPHHTASMGAVVGGGHPVVPGEISLAHGGVLFLDELPEFGRTVLESLREPLETGSISLARVSSKIEFPARFQLIAAMNPCPCGYAGEGDQCRCTILQIQRYRGRLSGPLLDRFDMFIHVSRQSDPLALEVEPSSDTSVDIAGRVDAARALALKRSGCPNAWMTMKDMRTCCILDSSARGLLEQAAHVWSLSHRACHRLLRLARTIADLAASETVMQNHIAEAMIYRKPLL